MGHANRLAALRKARRLSQADLARLLGCAQSQVDRLEKSERRLTVEWVLRVGEVLRVAPHEVVPELGAAALEATEAELLDRFRRASAEHRAAVMSVVRAMAPDAPRGMQEPAAPAPENPGKPRPRRPYGLHEPAADPPTPRPRDL